MTRSVSPIVPSRTAPLSMDVQRAILPAIPNPEMLAASAGVALSWARAEKVCVVSQVAFAPEYFAAVPTRNRAFAAVAENRFLADVSPDGEIDPSVYVRTTTCSCARRDSAPSVPPTFT